MPYGIKKKLRKLIRDNLCNSSLFLYLGRILVDYNHRKLISISKSESLIFLKPVSPTLGMGGPGNYYHFILDFLMPLNFLIKESSADVVFALEHFGNHSKKLQDIYPGRIKIIDDENHIKSFKHRKLVGMNPKWVSLSNERVEKFKNDLFERLNITEGNPSFRSVVLVERGSSGYSRGASRRSIINHEELSLSLKSIVEKSYNFYDLQMENLSFEEQLLIFDSAEVVIAQHGAVLANCLWMRAGSKLIEINPYKNRNHGKRIAEIKKLDYFVYKTSNEHAAIDTKHFVDWLAGFKELEKYFI